jgi:archaellum biogenesis ATPase FlaH
MSAAPVELITPTALQSQSIVDTATTSMNNFISEINDLSLDINNDVMNQSVLLLQQHIDEYSSKLELASKVANSIVKGINSLDNLQ